MSATQEPTATPASLTGDPLDGGLSKKGLSAGTVGLIGAVVIGISCIAPAYTLHGGPRPDRVGGRLPGAGDHPGRIHPDAAGGLRLPGAQPRDARLGHVVHVGARARSARGSAGWPAGA